MAYREDEDAQRARIDELEKKLASAEGEIAALKGEGPRAGTGPGVSIQHSRISNGPTLYEREITLPHPISELGYEAIANVLRARLKLNAAQVGRSLVVPNVFTLDRVGSGTRIRLVGDWRGLPGSVIAAGGVTGGFGGLLTAGSLADIVSHGLGVLHAYPVDLGLVALALTTLVTATAGASWAARRRVAKTGAHLLAEFEGTFTAIEALAEQHAVRARVDADVGSETEASDAEAEVSRGQVATRRS